MGSTIRPTKEAETESPAPTSIRWRSWPLADNPRYSWLLPAGIIGTGVFVGVVGGGWFLAGTTIAALAVAMWQFLLPVSWEICSLGVRRYALGRMRLVPWSAIRSFQLRPSGVVFFQRTDPVTMDRLRSLFVPYPSDPDDVVVAVRMYLSHAVEVP